MKRVLLGVLAVVAAVPASSAAANPLRLVGVRSLDPRLEQLAFETPAVNGITYVRVLLPSGYDAHPRGRYPVLYLLHGAIDNYTSWTVKGDAEQLTASYPLIVVMPDTGPTGDYTNWYNGGAGGPPECTAPVYRPGETLLIVVRDATGAHRRRLVIAPGGRLSVSISLGPSNPYQEYTPGAATLPPRSVTADVSAEVVG